MDILALQQLKTFYQKELKENILPFWLPRCVDEKNGGFLNCFTNDGTRLVSREKYTWSQGRFLWLWAKLASMEGDTFTGSEKETFLTLAENGKSFLRDHVLLGEDDWRCTYLMDEYGEHQYTEGSSVLDMSISADCFVVLGFARYAAVTHDLSSWEFAKNLYFSVRRRYKNGQYYSLPYPLSAQYRCHGEFMMLTQLANEMYRSSLILEPGIMTEFLRDSQRNSDIIFLHFVDTKYSLHEIRSHSFAPVGGIFGNHVNPGHTIEDMWFQIQSCDITGVNHWKEIRNILLRAFEIGWDKDCGGFLHFADVRKGAKPCGSCLEGHAEPLLQLVLDDWGSKLWWVHSEALYTYLLMYFRTREPIFLEYYKTIEEYVFRTFPNPDRNIREWIQIRTKSGQPMDKVVALPVKDPFHIIRNLTQIIELLEEQIGNRS